MTRLNKFVVEAIRLQDRAARRLAMAEIDKVVDFFSKKDWDMETALLGALLNVAYRKHGVTFSLASPDQDAYRREDFDYVTAGQTLVDGTIVVYVSDQAGKVLASDMKDKENAREAFEKGQFFKELISVFSHELVHREQVEMTAWAHDAALEFVNNKVDHPNEIQVYKDFFGVKHPVFKRFMKKFSEFITQFKERKKRER